jgi:uncharacterized protein (DUF1778 family)
MSETATTWESWTEALEALEAEPEQDPELQAACKRLGRLLAG